MRIIAATLAVCTIALFTHTSALAAQTATTPQPAATEVSSIDQANAALASGDYAAAQKLLTGLNIKTPNNPEILYDLGLTAEALHPDAATNPEAEAFYRKAIAANPLFPMPHVALGLLLARENHPAEAHGELVTATQIPDISPALKARALRALARLDLNGGTTQSAKPDPAIASSELLAAVQITPETPDDMLLAAEIAEATPDLAAAEQAYRRYLSTAPNDPNATAALAHVLVAVHRPAEAESLLNAALTVHPDDPALTAQLAAALLASGDPTGIAQATPLLEKLHAAHPDDRAIARLLARVYLETGHPEQADPLYAALIAAQTPPDPTLLDGRAEALIRLRRPAEAEKLLQQAVANPGGFATPSDFADATTRLAFAAAEIDDPNAALHALALRATVLPPSPSSLFLEATARDALHQSSQAVDLYKRFLAEAHGNFPEQESKARERLAALGRGR